MNRRGILKTTLLAVLAGPHIAGCMADGDFRDELAMEEFHVLDRTLEFPVLRMRTSKDVPEVPLPLIRRVGLDWEAQAARQPLLLLEGLWDWPRRTKGSIRICMDANPVPEGFSIGTEAGIRRMLEAQLADRAKDFARRGGQPAYAPRYVFLPGVVQLNGASAVTYSEQHPGDSLKYVIPITLKSYLEVTFDFHALNDTSWRPMAGRLVEEMMKSARFTGEWGVLE